MTAAENPVRPALTDAEIKAQVEQERHRETVGPVGRSALGVDPDRRGVAPAGALLPTPSAREATRWGMPSAETSAARVAHPDRSVNLEDAVALLPKHVDDQWLAALPDGRTIDYGPAVRRWETIFGEPAPPARDDKGRLNPNLPRWMMGLPRGWLDGLPRTAQLRCAGNGCQPQTARLAAELLLANAVRHDRAVAS